MPELPEVETIKRGLEGLILRKKMVQAGVLCEKSFMGEFVPGVVVGMRRRGKALIIDLDNGNSLMIHLRMTGQLIYRGGSLVSDITAARAARLKDSDSSSAGALEDSGGSAIVATDMLDEGQNFAGGHPSENFVDELPNKQTRVILYFESGEVLYFNDQRKFGFIKALPTAEVENDAFVKRLAKEPWVMTMEELKANLSRHKNSAVKGVILDQTVVCGLGNIYADESLYLSQIHPERKAGSLRDEEIGKLLEAMRTVMEKSIEAGGSTIRNYVKADGTRGNYLDLFVKAYGREGQPCERCGGLISKTKVAGRGTHFCPECQKKEG